MYKIAASIRAVEKFQFIAIITVMTDPITVANAFAPHAHPIITLLPDPRYLSPVGNIIPIGIPRIEIRRKVVNSLMIRFIWISRYVKLNRNSAYKISIRQIKIDTYKIVFSRNSLLTLLENRLPIPEDTSNAKIMAEMEYAGFPRNN